MSDDANSIKCRGIGWFVDENGDGRVVVIDDEGRLGTADLDSWNDDEAATEVHALCECCVPKVLVEALEQTDERAGIYFDETERLCEFLKSMNIDPMQVLYPSAESTN